MVLIAAAGFASFSGERDLGNRILLKENAIEIARLKIQNQFQEFERNNAVRSTQYLSIHRALQAELLAAQAADLEQLKIKYGTAVGYPIELFLISPDYVIYDTTFPADMNLDFKLPYFPDAQASLRKAARIDEPIVGLPTQELSTGSYKIYSLSSLPEGEFLQIGFSDPAIGERIGTIKQILEDIPNVVSVDLYVSHSENAYLAPFSRADSLSSESLDKEALLAQVNGELSNDKEQFSKLSSIELVEQAAASADDVSTLFFELGVFDLTEDFQYRYLAKVRAQYPLPGWFDRNVYAISLSMILLSIGLLALYFFWARSMIATPLEMLHQAIAKKEKLNMENLPRITAEFRDLLSTYNFYYDRNQELEEELRQSAVTDPVTQLYNRSVLPEVHNKLIKIARRNGHNIAVLYIDLDHFKQYNDHYGHEYGDRVLTALADLIRNEFKRPTDTAVRLGGEEFLVYFEADSFDNAEGKAEKLRESLYQQNISHAASLSQDRITLSAGLVTVEATREIPIEQLIALADEQLYRAKEQGRNRVCARNMINAAELHSA